MGNLTIHFCQGSAGTYIRRGGQYISHIYWKFIQVGVTVPKIIEIGWHSTKLLQKEKAAVFLDIV